MGHHGKHMSKSEQASLLYIDNDSALQQFCASLAGCTQLAIDTEFVRDKTYYPQLCLIQIASDKQIACIDPFKIGDFSALNDILRNPAILKIFHAARQDLEVLLYALQVIPRPVFDTQLAATLLGLGEQIGYANLVQHFLHVQLGKQHARADWEQRPLQQEQLAYAADDVRYLIQMYPMIMQQLESLGREHWLREDFIALTDEQLYQSDPAIQWQRISGVQKLRRKQLAVLRELANWREQQAQTLNKPRKWILADNLILAIAMQAPTTLQKLTSVRGINDTVINKHGTTLIQLINKALVLPESDWPLLHKRRQLSKDQEAAVDALMAIVKIKANEHTLNVSAITNRHELESLTDDDQQVTVMTGWRRELVGNSLLAFLHGKLTLHYEQGRLILSDLNE